MIYFTEKMACHAWNQAGKEIIPFSLVTDEITLANHKCAIKQ